MNISVFSCSLVGFRQQNHFGSDWEKIMVRIKVNNPAMIAKIKLISEVWSNETPDVSRREHALRHNTLKVMHPQVTYQVFRELMLCVFVCCAGFKCSIPTLFLHLCLYSHAQPFDLSKTRTILVQPLAAWKNPLTNGRAASWHSNCCVCLLGMATMARNMRVWKIQCIRMKRVEIVMQEWLEKSRRKLSYFCKSIILKPPLHRGEWFSWFKMKYCFIYVLCKNLMHVQVHVRKMCEMAIVKEKEIHANPWASKVFSLC